MKKILDSSLLGLVFIFVIVPFVYFFISSLLNFNSAALTGSFFSLLARSWFFGFLQAGLSASIVCLLASFFAASFLELSPSHQNKLSLVSSAVGKVYFVLPGTVISLALLSLPFGLSNSLSGWPLIITAHTLWSLFFMTHIIHRKLNAWLNSEGRDLLQSAHTLGASRWQSTREILWPYLKTELREVFVLVFVWSFGAFSTVFLLGNGPQHSTVEVLLFYTLFNDLDSTRLLFVVLLNLATQFWVLKFFYLNSKTLEAAAPEAEMSRSTSLPLGLPKGSSFLALFFLLLCGSLLLKHFLSLGAFSNLLGNPETHLEIYEALGNSLIYGIVCAAFALLISFVIAGASARARRLLLLLFGVSPMVLASLWSQLRMEYLPQLDSNLFIASFALVFSQIPLLCLWIESSLSSLDSSSETYLSSLGLSPFQKLLRFRLPYLSNVLIQIQILIFSIALGDLVMSSVFAPQDTLLAQAARRLSQSYSFDAASSILILSLGCMGVWMLLLSFAKRVLR